MHARSTFGGAGAEVLALFFGTDDYREIHYNASNLNGIARGQEIGRYLCRNCARPLPTAGAGLLVLFGAAYLLRWRPRLSERETERRRRFSPWEDTGATTGFPTLSFTRERFSNLGDACARPRRENSSVVKRFSRIFRQHPSRAVRLIP